MRHFPIFMAVAGRRIVVSGGGEAALAKLRVLLKTEARLSVFAATPAVEIVSWAAAGRLRLVRRPLEPGDAVCAVLFYAANDDETEDARVTRLAQADGALTNWVDNLDASRFITPAIVDRDPVTVAIGTEGTAPVLARAIKADMEARLPSGLGVLARFGKGFRKAANALPFGRVRRDFWREYYFKTGPNLPKDADGAQVRTALDGLLADYLSRRVQPGRVALVGAGPGDPELLTLKARRALDEADVVIHDRLVAPEILELARREAKLIQAGKEGFGPSMPQENICQLMIKHAAQGDYVVRLKSGDPAIYGRLDDETGTLDAAHVDWVIVPGITAASAATAAIGQSLTKRGRNSALRFLTGHDVKGFAEHDWRGLARSGQVAAIYMARRGALFLQGRLMMHGAAPDTPVTVVENVTRSDQRVIQAQLGDLAATIAASGVTGPAILLYGLAPHTAEAALSALPEPQEEHA
ncbi:MAG: uroporphyrinogen-III C-methyltransferase [Rhodobacteraceae bacterium]|nr:uroporphyrinogen-III C-methyltransferase [Paracoccaceae bacterium]